MTGITDLHSDIPTSNAAGQGPGRLVRQAREQNKLSLEDLAAQIKLSRFTLDAIERDDFAQLNEPVYVRGYYRKLSKVLPVAEADLMAAYERVAGHKTPPHPSKLILAGGAELGSGRRISFKLAMAIILLGLVVGALAFWGKNHTLLPTVTPPAVETTPSETRPELAPTTEAPAPVAPSPEAAVSSPVAPAVPAASEPVSAAVMPANATGPLQIQFNGSSWTEVKDATGKVLLSGLVESGSNQALDGKPPFVVFLGNAPGVKITYNGQSVDTSQYHRGDNTARITLP
ncbi:MAG: DUF4115 domain-containing protein [Stagnimonas sp.]|nr:DUF4115 domain-containing protein [Stagnimonas sp.]